jgi:hypothetical protein
MRLYSIPDIAHLLQDELQTKGFYTATVPRKPGVIDVFQQKGVVSQRFKITVESSDRDPL